MSRSKAPAKAPATADVAASRQWRSHLRLLVAALLGALAGYLSPGTIATRVLIGWDVAAALWLMSAATVMATTTPAELKKVAYKEDETASAILVVLVLAIVASLFGIIVEIGEAAQSQNPTVFIVIGIATLVLSWLLMHTLFAIHYAHRFYGGRARSRMEAPDGGLAFPGPHDGTEKNPGYFDFAYIAFCVGMTCQVSDVDVLTRDFRRMITVHAVLSFFYNLFILGLAVNLFGSLRA